MGYGNFFYTCSRCKTRQEILIAYKSHSHVRPALFDELIQWAGSIWLLICGVIEINQRNIMATLISVRKTNCDYGGTFTFSSVQFSSSNDKQHHHSSDIFTNTFRMMNLFSLSKLVYVIKKCCQLHVQILHWPFKRDKMLFVGNRSEGKTYKCYMSRIQGPGSPILSEVS